MKKRDWYVLGGITAGAALLVGVAVALSKSSSASHPVTRLEPPPPGAKTLQGGGATPQPGPRVNHGGSPPAPAPPSPRPGVPGPAPHLPRPGVPGPAPRSDQGGPAPADTYIPFNQRAIHPVFA